MTICSVVQGSSAGFLFGGELDFFGVVGNGVSEAFELAEDEASVGENDGVEGVEFCGFVEVLERGVEVAHISKTAPSIMPIHRMLRINLYRICKILYRILKLHYPIPNQPSPIIRRRIIRINIQRRIKILNRIFKFSST